MRYNLGVTKIKGVVINENLRNRSFLTLLDFSRQEVEFLLTLSEDLKRAKYIGTENPMLKIKYCTVI